MMRRRKPAAEAAPEPELEAEPEPAPAEEDVLELTDPIAPEPEPEPELPPLETVGDIDVYSPPTSGPEPAPAPPIFDRDEVADNLVGDTAASAAASAFGGLRTALLMPKDGRTLEDVVRELLRRCSRSGWTRTCRASVETKVEEEVQRIARGRG
ncbi:DUF2497 domain-containing protein [Caulobacter segnis]